MIRHIAQLVKLERVVLIRVVVVAVTLFALPVVGIMPVWLSPRVSPFLILVPLVAALGALVFLQYLESGIIAMLLAAVFIRFRIPTGTASEIVISLVICAGCIALWIIRMLIQDKSLSLKPSPVNTPLLAFIATVPISWFWGQAFRDPLVHEIGHPLVAIAAGLVIMLLPACLLLVANTIDSMRWLQALVWIVLGEGLVVLFLDIGSTLVGGALRDLRIFLYTNGIIHLNSHGLLSMWCISFALAIALFNRRIGWLGRGLLIAYAGAWVYWGFYLRTSWLTGWAPAFVAASVVAYLRSKRLFLVVAAIVLLVAGAYYIRTAFEAETLESGYTRLSAYAVNWRITKRHLLFGTGPAGYASYYMSYFPTQAMASHSNYIDIFAQTGIVGSIFFMWFFGAQAWGSYRLQRRLQEHNDFARSLAVAVLGGTAGCIVAMGLGDWVTPFAYTQGVIGFDLAMLNWVFMGSIWALNSILQSELSTVDGIGVSGEASL
jgi:hypothetical protein